MDNPEPPCSSWTRPRPHALSHMFREVLAYSTAIDAIGLGPASRVALERWALFPRVEAHGSASGILADGTCLAFGNGLCGFEIPLFGSLLRRDDVLFVGGHPRVRAVWSSRSPRLRHPNRPALAAESTSSEESDPTFRPSLCPHGTDDPVKRAAEALSAGRGVVYVLPRGFRCDRQVWDQIGSVVERLLATGATAASNVWLVPLVYQVSPIHVLASRFLPRRSITRFLARVRSATWTGLPSVFLPPPVAVSDLQLAAGACRGDIGRQVGDVWLAARDSAQTVIPRWTPLVRWPR